MGPPPTPATKPQERPSLSVPMSRSTKRDPSIRLSRLNTRASSSVLDHPSVSTSRERSPTTSMASEETPISPSIDDDVGDEASLSGLKDGSEQVNGNQNATPKDSPTLSYDDGAVAPTLQPPVSGLTSARKKQDHVSITKRDLEQMRDKYTVMEKKRMEDRDKLKSLESVKAERDKFESTLQKLQRKCQAQSKEIAEWRRQLRESEAKVEEIEKADAERGSQIELALLDKEMAEELLEAATAELEIMKERCEELEIEAEFIRNENKELTSGMTSEERSSAGWLQMENENQRLRDALVALRDMTQETEKGLKSHVKELEEDLGYFETLKSEHQKTKAELASSRATIQALKENLDAADNQELLVAQLNEEKDTLAEQVKLLSKDVMTLKEDLEASRQLQDAQDETERLLQEDLDDVRAFALERDQKTKDQAKMIDNLEYTLLRFKEVAVGLQNDLDDARANKRSNESESNELNAKKRAMMDLNLRLQSTAAKSQTQKLESALDQIQAEDTALHLAITQCFVPEDFKDEIDPILAVLRFKRIGSKANLLRATIKENIDQKQDTSQANLFTAFDVIENLQWVSSCCLRFHSFMNGCTAEDFSKFNAAPYELEPVERSLDLWIGAAKRMEVDYGKCAQDLPRLMALLSDLSGKTVPSSPETFADTVIGRLQMMHLCCEVFSLELDFIKESVRNKIVLDDDEGLHRLCHTIQGLVNRSRTSWVVVGKLLRTMDTKKSHSMTLGETSLRLFEQAESAGKELSTLARVLGQRLVNRFNEDPAGNEVFNLDDVSHIMQESARDWLKHSTSKIPASSNALEMVSDLLSVYHSRLEGLLGVASNLSNFSELERRAAPWTVRAKIRREQKTIDPQIEEQLRKLERAAHEQRVSMSAKDKAIEEQNLKIELLEARGKAAKDHATVLQKLEKELAEAVADRGKAASELEGLVKEKQALEQRHAEANARLALLNQSVVAGDSGAAASTLKHETRSLELAAEIDLLKEEMTSLQSAVRFLKAENHRLLYPFSPVTLAATNHAWLETNPLPKPGAVSQRGGALVAEVKDVFKDLLQLSSIMRPLQLQNPSEVNAGSKQSSWRPRKKTPQYLVSQQREEFDKWSEWKRDLVQNTLHRPPRSKVATTMVRQSLGKPKSSGIPPGQVVDMVEISGSPP